MTTLDEADRKARLERARETGLFRYSLVQELAEAGITPAERGRRARELAGRAHDGPGGRAVSVSRGTLDRWRRVYEAGGFDALVPSLRQCQPRTPDEVLALAEALKREKPGRTAAQVRRILQVTSGWAPSDRTLQRLFERLELSAPLREQEDARAFGRFECTRPNEMWTGDTLHGPVIAGGKSYLFAFLDDHSRAVMGARWAYHDDVVRMAAAFRPALQRRGVPQAIYLLVLAIPGSAGICPAACGNDTLRRSLTFQALTRIVRQHLAIKGDAEVCGGRQGSSRSGIGGAAGTGRAA